MSTTDGYQLGLYYGDAETYAGSSTWTEVTQVEECTPPTIAVDDMETKHLKTADRFKTYKGSWRDGGEVTATVQYTEAQHAALAALVGVNKGWRVLFADANTGAGPHDGGVGFAGYLKGLGQPVEADGLVKVSLTIKVSGKPVPIAAAAGA